MREISIHDFGFARVPATCYSPAGVPYIRWVNAGMPKISQALIKSTFFLFRDKTEAEEGLYPGGTGFIVSVPSEKHPDGPRYYYAISCLHVVSSTPCVRINKTDGGVDPLDFIPDQWYWDYELYGDVAACMLSADDAVHDAADIPIELFLTKETSQKYEVGAGENIFMIGLFVDIERKVNRLRNNPMARFGNISMMPSPTAKFVSSKKFDTPREFFLLDVHSRKGYSGSPVFVFRSADSDLTKSSASWLGSHFHKLLGIHCAQFPEYWPFDDGTEPSENQMVAMEKSESGKRIIGLSGITMAAPAWDIAALLYSEKLRGERMRLDEQGRPLPSVILESPPWRTGERQARPKSDAT